MNKLSDFSSVFEVAFAVNAVFYIFTYAPLAESEIDKRLNQLNKLFKRADKVGVRRGDFPIFWYSKVKFWGSKLVVGAYSIFASAIALLLLVVSGFNPELEISSFWVIVILLSLFVPVPSMVFLNRRIINAYIESEFDSIETKVIEEESKRNTKIYSAKSVRDDSKKN